jgi:hypothetical protein
MEAFRGARRFDLEGRLMSDSSIPTLSGGSARSDAIRFLTELPV